MPTGMPTAIAAMIPRAIQRNPSRVPPSRPRVFRCPPGRITGGKEKGRAVAAPPPKRSISPPRQLDLDHQEHQAPEDHGGRHNVRHSDDRHSINSKWRPHGPLSISPPVRRTVPGIGPAVPPRTPAPSHGGTGVASGVRPIPKPLPTTRLSRGFADQHRGRAPTATAYRPGTRISAPLTGASGCRWRWSRGRGPASQSWPKRARTTARC